ncbi:hypothetical protein J4Q44_G00327260 [Coregonus suidteri]|uniref:Uncharacterized protein n=1 Tax=Coregonus suidteri TaxID=861788 RepID=A0AAN8Q9K4_9TELE
MRVLNYLNEKHTDPETDELLTMATFLDPRFKTTYMTNEKLVKVLTVLDQRCRSPNLALPGPETGDGTEEWTQTKDPPRYSQLCCMQLKNKLRKRKIKSIGFSRSIQRTAIHVVV